MKSTELQDILQSEKQLTIKEIKNIIYELKNDVIHKAELDNHYECGFYNGEVNAFYICLDLLDKCEDSGRNDNVEYFASILKNYFTTHYDDCDGIKCKYLIQMINTLEKEFKEGTLCPPNSYQVK